MVMRPSERYELDQRRAQEEWKEFEKTVEGDKKTTELSRKREEIQKKISFITADLRKQSEALEIKALERRIELARENGKLFANIQELSKSRGLDFEVLERMSIFPVPSRFQGHSPKIYASKEENKQFETEYAYDCPVCKGVVLGLYVYSESEGSGNYSCRLCEAHLGSKRVGPVY